jgi:hypothetical protein
MFAAMLALLSTQAPTLSVRFIAAFEMVCRTRAAQTDAEQQAPRDIPRVGADPRGRLCAPVYVSFAGPEPDTVLFFQLPPPASSFVS